MNTFKVVITDNNYDTIAPEIELLESIGAEVVSAQCKTEKEVIQAAKDADGIISQYAPISRKVIEQLTNCKVVSRYGIGYDVIDVDAATEKGILVCNVTDYCIEEVSDHAFALLMASARKITEQDKAVRRGVWDYKVTAPIYRLSNQVLGLVGFGNIPQLLAKKAQAFGLRVIAHDPFIPVHTAEQLDVELVDLSTLCERSDFISVHAPLNEQTKGMIGKEQFKQMKEQAFLINTSRGPVVDEQALIEALSDNAITGAALDVLETEPIDFNDPLLSLENVILSAHIAWNSMEAELELKSKAAQNVADVLTGYYPTYLVNKEIKGTVF
ncbi:C-terminal binding protein [Virgibacillus litoralis]|uniref:D-3-phosphoglycerate dehydrogenase n=1 Tax=Virgibacillus litoralis TaxID=578221 RepID=A0ABS4HFU5_9BACI|nr:C-terminal binding protein [Virgibacillus litoralis]MBP1949775.1 D-3-phosphoglycerate dehydrogenase [Virgibacillus litoralis]